MEELTNERYYNILEKCTIEAFDSLKVKDLYPNNGTKAIWDVSTFTIQKGDGLPTNNDNALFRKRYIKENMTVTFLMALDRYWKDFEIKYSITRSFFYKKCYQSLLSKVSQSPLWQKPDFGFDIDAKPCKLTFIWNMKSDIEARSVEYQQPKASNPNAKESKPKKLAEKWHALHYWLELVAHCKKPPVDIDGGFIKSELEETGAQRCESKGQNFYREFIKMDINNPIMLKITFGNSWKEIIIELCENDIITANYINKKYN